jgi:hypothetical protein
MTIAELLIMSNVDALTRNGIVSITAWRDVRIYKEFRSYERAILSGTMLKTDVYAILAMQFNLAERTIRKALHGMCSEAVGTTSCHFAEASKN